MRGGHRRSFEMKVRLLLQKKKEGIHAPNVQTNKLETSTAVQAVVKALRATSQKH